MARGQVNNAFIAKRHKDFSGLRYGKCTPTDIDSFLELNGKLFIIAELKYGIGDLAYGQKLALERLVDAIDSDDKKSFGIVLKYDIIREEPWGQVIDVDLCSVEEIRWHGMWFKLGGEFIAKDIYDRIIKKFAPNKLDHEVNEDIHLDLYLDSLFNKK